MRSLRRALAATALLSSATLLTAASHASATPVVALRTAPVDPVGAYDWSLEAGGSAFSGTLTIAKVNDTTFTATIVHDMNNETVKAKYVKRTGDNMLIVSDTQYGDLTMELHFADAAVEGSWKVGDGSMGGGLKVTKKK
jgi:hypothetical protein